MGSTVSNCIIDELRKRYSISYPFLKILLPSSSDVLKVIIMRVFYILQVGGFYFKIGMSQKAFIKFVECKTFQVRRVPYDIRACRRVFVR